MLSRVAEAVYWMSRYLERAENLSRFIEVNWHLYLDQPDEGEQQWEPLVAVTGDLAFFKERYDKADLASVIHFLAFNPEYPNSIVSCLSNARENARSAREYLPSALWEQINIFYHNMLDAARNPEPVYANPYEFCEDTQRRGLMFSGMTLDLMPHDEAFQFLRLARRLERADKTSRILDVKYFILLPKIADVGSPIDEVQWAALLKTTNGLGSYRRKYGRLAPMDVAQYMLLDREFPRAVYHCLAMAQQSLHTLTGTPLDSFGNRAEQLLGLLFSQLAYQDIEDVYLRGLHEFIDNLQKRMNVIDEAVRDVFFSVKPV